MLLSSGIILGLLSLAEVSGNNNIGFLRKAVESGEEKVKQFDCTLKGKDQGTCDSTKSDDGSNCVWCSLQSQSIGVCVTEGIAEVMKEKIPGITCDDDTHDDDDDDDDTTPTEDDTSPNDDTVPSDYWTCILKYKTSNQCLSSGCAWCDTGGGYGICVDEKIAEIKSKSDWFSCSMPSILEDKVGVLDEDFSDPSDPSCIVATMSGDENTCKETMDADGKPCEWCSLNSFDFCVNVDQAQLVEQFGAVCGDDVNDGSVRTMTKG